MTASDATRGRRRQVRAYVIAVDVAALAVVVPLLATTTWPPDAVSQRGGAFAALALLTIVAEVLPALILRVTGLSQDRGPIILYAPSIGCLVALAAVFGTLSAVVVKLTATIAVHLLQRRGAIKGLFNIGQNVLYTAAAGGVGALFGWPLDDATLGPRNLAAFFLAVTAATGVNYILTGTVVGLSTDGRIGPSVRWSFSNGLLIELQNALVCPLAVVLSFDSPHLLLLLVAPLFGELLVNRAPGITVGLHIDSGTGIPNQAGGEHRLAEHLTNSGPVGSVVVVGSDRVDEISERLGQEIGDQLSAQVARRLSDGLDDVTSFARLGGDELLLFSPTAVTAAEAEDLARRALEVLGPPFPLEPLTFTLSASAGAVVVTPDVSAPDLVRRALVALRVARRRGGSIEVYDEARLADEAGRLALVEDLREALIAGALDVHFQPMAGTARRRITGMEALVRWTHPTQGPIDPVTIVRLAEPSQLLRELTGLVLDRAVTACAEWRHVPAYAAYTVAVNVSPRSLLDGELPSLVIAALARRDLPATALTLELTESVLRMRPDEIRPALDQLAELGVTISVDDLSGLASFTELADAPVTEVKIDRRCVTSMLDKASDAAAVRAIVGFANDIGIRVIAEGVEDDATWYRLDEYGCDAVQGHALAPAMPLDQLHAWLAENHYRHHGPNRRAPLGDVVAFRRPG